MALPTGENLAYRGITSGNAQCIAYRGFICGVIVQTWQKVVHFTLYITRQFNISIQR